MAREEEDERPKERSSDGMSHVALLGCCVCNLKRAMVGFKCLLGGTLLSDFKTSNAATYVPHANPNALPHLAAMWCGLIITTINNRG